MRNKQKKEVQNCSKGFTSSEVTEAVDSTRYVIQGQQVLTDWLPGCWGGKEHQMQFQEAV